MVHDGKAVEGRVEGVIERDENRPYRLLSTD
jgi:hypothetical protein